MLTKIRSAVFGIWMPVSALLTGLICLPSLLRRDWALGVARFWARMTLASLKLICGLDYRVEGTQNLPTGPALVAVKHQSMWETVAMTVLLPQPCFVLKKELLAIPIWGWWCRAAGFIGVDRAAGGKAMRDMLEKAAERLGEGAQILIFPEGTRTPPGETGTYHPGVAGLYRALQCPCVPVAHDSGVYFRYPGITRKPGTITLSALPAIQPGLKRPDFMAQLQSAIETESRALATGGAARAAAQGPDG